jgi:hypothetical protein
MNNSQENIISITKVEQFELPFFCNNYINYDVYLGYVIETNKQKIYFLISQHRECCEHYDVECNVDCNDDSIINNNNYITNIELSHTKIDTEYSNEIEMTLFTKNNTLELNMYCYHNGYYPHSYVIKYNDILDYGWI